MSDNAIDLRIKLLMLGDSGVGKTCLLHRYVEGSFSTFINTIGIDFKMKTVSMDGKRVKIWDTAGHERFRTITSAYNRGSQGILLVYDVSDRTSFTSIRNWISQIKLNADVDVNVVLIGNKSDKVEQRVVSREEGAALAQEYGVRFYETSASQGDNVDESYLAIATDVKDRLLREGVIDQQADGIMGSNRHKLKPQELSSIKGNRACC